MTQDPVRMPGARAWTLTARSPQGSQSERELPLQVAQGPRVPGVARTPLLLDPVSLAILPLTWLPS